MKTPIEDGAGYSYMRQLMVDTRIGPVGGDMKDLEGREEGCKTYRCEGGIAFMAFFWEDVGIDMWTGEVYDILQYVQNRSIHSMGSLF